MLETTQLTCSTLSRSPNKPRPQVDHEKRRSQYKCQIRRKHDTKSHHNNCDWIISGNLEHRETPKIADCPAWSTTKAKTVQNCSDRTLQIAPTTEPHLRFSTMSNRTPRSEWIG